MTPSATADGTPVPSSVPETPFPEPDAASSARALEVLDRWEQAVKSAPEGAIAFTGFVSHGGGWRGRHADEQKSAFLSGRIEASFQLPTDVPPPGEVTWDDGSRATVPLTSAAEAFDELRRGLVGGGCPECRPLEVVGTRLISRGAETSRGWASVPAWEFVFAGRDAPDVPVTQLAVRDRIHVPPLEDVGRDMGYALGTPNSTSLTVSFSSSACGPEDYTAKAVESELGVVVLVQPDPPPQPAATPRICRAKAVGGTAIVELESPLGSRTILDAVSGQPIPLYREMPGTPGAMPTFINGEPVLRGDAIAAQVAAATDDTAFLIGGLIDFFGIADCYVPPDFPETPLLRPCGGWPSMQRIPLVTDDWHPTPSQRYVLRVHVHDTRAADCPPAYQEQCERAVIVDEVVWQPDY